VFAFRSPARALAVGLLRQDHIYITTDEFFRFRNNRFDEMPCKLDSTENLQSFEKYLTPPWLESPRVVSHTCTSQVTAHTHTHIHIHTHTHIHKYIHTYIHTHTHTRTHAHPHTPAHTHIQAYTLTHTHTHTHTYTHTHTCTSHDTYSYASGISVW